jgi:transposase
MSNHQKETYTTEAREALVALYRQSGLTKKEFCQQEQLGYSTFKRWCGDSKAARLAKEKANQV